jgi:hypothetical protein
MDYQQAERVSSPKGAPAWTNKISNSMICNYFYIFFLIFAVWAGLSLLAGVWIFASRSKMTFGMLIALIINIILSFGISATTALFLYLICDRALKPAMVAAGFMNEGDMEGGQGGIEDGDEEPVYEEAGPTVV